MSQQRVMTPQSRRAKLVFVARFAAGMLVLYAVIAFNAVNDSVIIPFTALIARATALILGGAASGVAVTGTVIRSPLFALDVHNGCNGVEATILLIAAILAFPATLRSRLAGVAVTTVAIELLNLVRLTSLFWLGEHHRGAFDFFHIAVWQSLIILAAISMFILWTLNFAKRPLANSR
jgi:exosortase H (IPTLxxWG-CTERM-specific)